MEKMDNIDNKPDTIESVLALIKELALSFEHEMAASRAEYERRMKEADERRKEADELAERRMKEEDERRKEENERRNEENERRNEDEKRRKEEKEQYERYERRLKRQEELTGSWGNNFGSFAEEYFFNSFIDEKQSFFGETFDSIRRNVKDLLQIIEDEYDIVMLNGTSAAIIESKFKAHENDIPKVKKKAETFKINYPVFANHRIYLGLASMSFYPELEEKCKQEGIAIVKQVGDTVVIYDENLKVF